VSTSFRAIIFDVETSQDPSEREPQLQVSKDWIENPHRVAGYSYPETIALRKDQRSVIQSLNFRGGLFPTVDRADTHALFVPSPESMHLTEPGPVALVDGCISTQNLASPTRSENTVGYSYRGKGEGFEKLYDGSDEDEDWLYPDGSERSSPCGSASDFTILSRDLWSRCESPASSPTAQSLPVRKVQRLLFSSAILILTLE
jgi:hypothetical protein